MRCAFSIAVLGITAAMCAGQERPAQQACVDSEIRALRVEQAGRDWALDLIKNAKVLSRSPFHLTTAGDDGLVSVAYAAGRRVIFLPYITVGVCSKFALVTSFAFRPESVAGIEKNGRTFAYVAWGSVVSGSEPGPVGVGAKMNVVFYDLHGAGKFDTVQVAAPAGLQFIPDWVERGSGTAHP